MHGLRPAGNELTMMSRLVLFASSCSVLVGGGGGGGFSRFSVETRLGGPGG